MKQSKFERKDIEDVIGLTAMQEGMLFHTVSHPDSRQYVEQFRFRLKGEICEESFRRTWDVLVQTNEMLRSVIRWQQLDEPVQVVLKNKSIPMVFHDLSRLSPEEYVPRLEQWVDEDRRNPVELEREPLRITVLRLNDSEAEMILTFHHILFDGWSNGILLSEFLDVYQSICEGNYSSILPKTKYKEFYKWYRSGDLEAQDIFWREYMLGFDTLTPLPYDYPKLEEIDTQETFQFDDPAKLVASLESCCRKHNLTLSSLVYVCWGLLLQKYNNACDVVFGTTVAGRPSAIDGIDRIVGMFINTLPVRLKASKEDSLLQTWSELSLHMQKRTTYEHTPLTTIKKWTAVANERNIFDSLVVIDNYPLGQIIIERNRGQGKIRVDSFQLQEMTNFDVTLQWLLVDDARVLLHFNRRLFSRATIRRMASHFINILRDSADDPARPLAAISMISPEEKEQVLREFNNEKIFYSIPHTIPMEFLRQAAQNPGKDAVRFQRMSLSYDDMMRQVLGLASHLRSLGVLPGDRIVLLFPRSIEMVVGMMAILQAGAACVPLDVSYPPERNQLIIQDSGARFILKHQDLEEISNRDLAVVSYCLGMELPDRAGEEADESLDPSSLAYIVYTSGSTGKPKGALLNHSGIVNHAFTKMEVLGIDANDVVGNNFSINVIASIWQVLSALFGGATLVVYEDEVEQDPYLQFQRVAADGVTVIEVIPSILKAYLFLIDEGKREIELPLLRKIALTSEETKPALVNAFYSRYAHIDLVDCYGQTECCDDVLHYTIPHDTETVRVPIGTPSRNTCIFILNHHDQLQPAGLAGEICVSGAGVGNGYWNRPELNREKFVDNPVKPGIKMYRTGDLGKWLEDGTVVYLGRLDHQVKIRGNRIELREIETVMAGHGDILEAAVVTKLDHHGETTLHAFFVAKREINAAEIRQYLGAILPDYMVPGMFTRLDKMPQTPNMKIDRKQLITIEGTVATGVAFKPPRNAVEKDIQGIWKQLLGRDDIGIHDNFFDLGGHSLLLIKLKNRLEKAFEFEFQLVDLFKYPTIAHQAEFVEQSSSKENPPGGLEAHDARQHFMNAPPHQDVAVIGLSLAVPGAGDIHAFWDIIGGGINTISMFSDEELERSPLDRLIRGNCRLVPAGGILGDVDLFDAEFFGYSPREADVLDPQQRLFLEYSWKALEDAGYGDVTQAGLVGVYGGVGFNTYLLNNVMNRPDVVNRLGEFQIMIANDKDFLATRVAYKLNLKGPAISIQSACSTSLVVCHLARQGLLAGDCDLAVAGGVAVRVPEKTGYYYTEGGHLSPDGYCRTFSAEANGTVFGNGVGVMVLKRLNDAVEDRDHIYAVVKSSAINNDGSHKVGFTSPGEQGQEEVVLKALRSAGIDPETVGYIETHGTGTVLGDPVEISALSAAFRRFTAKKQFCALGSVKPNIGHLDAAAGIVGFIKAILCLTNKKIPPSIQVNDLNPNIDFEYSPFYVNRTLVDWNCDGSPRRAAVSSLGIGGTNAHIILEEAPDIAAPATTATTRPWNFIALSARTPSALEKLTEKMAAHSEARDPSRLPDVAFTLHRGRKRFSCRKVCLVPFGSVPDWRDPNGWKGNVAHDEGLPPVVFLFPGQGSQYVDMCRDLYDSEMVFRREMDRCFDILLRLGADLKGVLYPSETRIDAEAAIEDTVAAQPLIFAIEYALARLLMYWGIRPYCMVGHSIGEYAAACVAGVFSLEDALNMVLTRGRLMGKMPSGVMVSVALSEERLLPLLKAGVELAAVNSSSLCVVSGQREAIETWERIVGSEGVDTRRLHTSHAFHSELMEPAMREFERAIAGIRLQPPSIPFFSNVTGEWIKDSECVSPDYWARQLRRAVRFSNALDALLDNEAAVFVEVGPSNALCTFARRHEKRREGHRIVDLVRHPQKDVDDGYVLIDGLSRLWLYGADIDFSSFYHDDARNRIPLPVYPFEKKSYWLSPDERPEISAVCERGGAARNCIDDWCYIPSWKRAMPVDALPVAGEKTLSCGILFFTGSDSLGRCLAAELKSRDCDVIVVEASDRFSAGENGGFTLNYHSRDDYDRLFHDLQERDFAIDKIVHSGFVHNCDVSPADVALPVLFLAQAAVESRLFHPIDILFITSPVYRIQGSDPVSPQLAVLEGALKVVSQEFPNMTGRILDIGTDEQMPSIVEEILAPPTQQAVVYRDGQRWTQVFDALCLPAFQGEPPVLKHGGVYLLVGGLGKIGLTIAGFLARLQGVKLILVGRRSLPEGLDSVRRLEGAGADVLVLEADACDRNAMENAVLKAEAKFGAIDGVFYSAGEMGGSYFKTIPELTVDDCLPQFQARCKGLEILSEMFQHRKTGFVLLTSSLSAALGGLTLFAYSAANCFVDAFCIQQNRATGTRWLSVGWPHWQFEDRGTGDADPLSITPDEGVEVLKRVLRLRRIPRVIVSTTDLNARLRQWVTGIAKEENPRGGSGKNIIAGHQRPGLSCAFLEPTSEPERVVAEIWQEILGIQPIGVNDDFFELGGHSLLATKLASRLREIFQIDFPIQVLFARPTIRQATEYIAETWGDRETVEEIARVYRDVFSQ